MPTISVPSPQGEASFIVEDGILVPENGDSSLLGGEPSVDLFERFDGNVSDAADFILDLVNQGGSQL